MSLLENPRDVTIYGGTLQSAEAINNFYQSTTSPSSLLQSHIVSSAMHDSAERYDPPKCHPETRTAVLEAISEWLGNIDSNAPPVLWLSGPAGAGKSAIVQTLAERCQESGLLWASWFFSRTAPRRNEKKFLAPTLGYQLTMWCKEDDVAPPTPILDVIARDPQIFERSFRTQMEQLVVRRCLRWSDASFQTSPKVILIDGLDECLKEEEQRDILETIGYLAERYLGHLSIRWLIASRPERQIRETFTQATLHPLTRRIVLDQTYLPDADILLFLTYKFQMIRSKNPHLPLSWPGSQAIEKLVAKSSGQFIYAATVIRFISSPRADPQRNLEIILKLITDTEDQTPYAELDALYTYILDAVAPKSLPVVMNIISNIIFINEPSLGLSPLIPSIMSLKNPTHLAWLLFNGQSHEVYRHLIDMHSLMDLPPPNLPASADITVLHASFGDYLADPARAKKYHITKGDAAVFYVINLLKHLMLDLVGPPRQSSYFSASKFAEPWVKHGLFEWLDHCKPSQELKQAFQVAMFGRSERILDYLRDMGVERAQARLVGLSDLSDLLSDQQYEAMMLYIKRSGGLGLVGSFTHLLARIKRKLRRNVPQEREKMDTVCRAMPIVLSVSLSITLGAGNEQWIR